MKNLLLTTICAAGLATGASAATVTLDFVALAAGNEGVIEGDTITVGDLGVTVTSSSNAYLDDLSSGGLPGGLGVCGALVTGGCASGQDEINEGEFVTLTFNRLVSQLSDFSFTDGSHLDLNSSDLTWTASGERLVGGPIGPENVSFELAATSVYNYGGFDGTSFTFAYGGDDPSSFYVNAVTVTFEDPAPVPLPAGLPLLAGALGMLAYARRKSA